MLYYLACFCAIWSLGIPILWIGFGLYVLWFVDPVDDHMFGAAIGKLLCVLFWLPLVIALFVFAAFVPFTYAARGWLNSQQYIKDHKKDKTPKTSKEK